MAFGAIGLGGTVSEGHSDGMVKVIPSSARGVPLASGVAVVGAGAVPAGAGFDSAGAEGAGLGAGFDSVPDWDVGAAAGFGGGGDSCFSQAPIQSEQRHTHPRPDFRKEICTAILRLS